MLSLLNIERRDIRSGCRPFPSRIDTLLRLHSSGKSVDISFIKTNSIYRHSAIRNHSVLIYALSDLTFLTAAIISSTGTSTPVSSLYAYRALPSLSKIMIPPWSNPSPLKLPLIFFLLNLLDIPRKLLKSLKGFHDFSANFLDPSAR